MRQIGRAVGVDDSRSGRWLQSTTGFAGGYDSAAGPARGHIVCLGAASPTDVARCKFRLATTGFCYKLLPPAQTDEALLMCASSTAFSENEFLVLVGDWIGLGIVGLGACGHR